MDFTDTFIRVPFPVKALRITLENIEEVAKVLGTVRRTKKGVPFIRLDQGLVPKMSRAYIGWYVTEMGSQYRCYAAEVFEAQYVPHTGNVVFTFPTVEIADHPTVVTQQGDE